MRGVGGLWIGVASRYPVFSARDRRRIAFGPDDDPANRKPGRVDAAWHKGLLNLAYLWFDPGRTRFPVRGGKHWLQVEDPERYSTITNDLLIELFYPTSTNKQRKRLAFEARKSLAQLVKNGEARIVKGRLMPPEPRVTFAGTFCRTSPMIAALSCFTTPTST